MKTSLRAKLVRSMIALLVVVLTATLAVVAGLNYQASRRTLSTIEGHLTANIEHKGTGLVTNQALGLRDLVMENAFGDVARLVERTVQGDEQIVYGLFVDDDGKSWAFATRQGLSKDSDTGKRIARDASDSSGGTKEKVRVNHRRVLGQSVFEFVIPVIDDKGAPLGKLLYGLSDGPLQEALAEARADSRRNLLVTVGLLLLLGTVTIVVGAIGSRRSAARITQPVTDLTRAVNTLASGKRDTRVQISSGDELEVLGGAFNKMVGELAESYQRLENMNRTLEIKVEERTGELASRNRDMRLVLDNINQGFLTVSITGKLAQERSAIVDRWFGSYGADTLFSDYIQKSDPFYAEDFRLGFEALVEDIMPRDLCLDQMPARLRREGREYRCSYFAIAKGEHLDGLLIVINDVSAELLHSRQEAERKEILAMFEALTEDRSGFLGFMDEADELLRQLRGGDLGRQRRALHTLKGNAGMVGFGIVAELCQQAEDELAEHATSVPPASRAAIEERWAALKEALESFMGDRARDVLELSPREVEALERDIRAGAPPTQLLERLASWGLEPTELPLRRVGRHAVALTRRLGKGELDVQIESHGVRLAPKVWAGFWTDLVHVVRNAVDHGLETPAEREAAGKSDRPRLRLSSALIGRELVIEVEDFGRGVDWNRVRATAEQLGLPSVTQEDLTEAIFHPGLSTATEITTISGRGVGLSAVRRQVQDLGGQVAVLSNPGLGTCFRFTFAMPHAGRTPVTERPLSRIDGGDYLA